MGFKTIGLGLEVAALMFLCNPLAQAASVELEVFEALNTSTNSGQCPEKVVVTEQSQPYREGSYATDGSANLGWLAEKFSISTIDNFSVTWAAQLKPKYSKCAATGRIVKQDNEKYDGHSYLRLRFLSGKVYLILDMTGMSDANGYTNVILRKGVRNNNPFWSWGGTD